MVPSVSDPVLNYWRTAFEGDQLPTDDDLRLTIVPTLHRERPVMFLETTDGDKRAAVAPDLAHAIGLGEHVPTTADLRERLLGEGVVFHDPDFLFYAPADFSSDASDRIAVRKLDRGDLAAFAKFHSTASEQDREDAFVELDHWAVFGCFEGSHLVSAASAILWEEGPIADLGVLTLPDARGKGYARAAVQAIVGFARRNGYEAQYRCQTDNDASIAVAKACGLHLFGEWIVGSRCLDQVGE